MIRKFYSSHSGIISLSVLCIVISLCVQSSQHKLSWLSVETSLLSASSLILLLPLKGESIKCSSIFALSYFVSFLCCLFFGLKRSFLLALTILVLAVFSFVNFLRRYRHIRPLFNQKSVWYSVESDARFMYSLFFCSLTVFVFLAENVIWLRIPLAFFALVLYALLLVRASSGYTLLMRKSKEKTIRKLINGNLRTDSTTEEEEDISESMKELFNRILAQMETDKAYLNCDYSLQELASSIYTNKTSVSKTINLLSGKNFRQFINYYRIQHSINLIRSNPHLRIEEVSSQSGFHSTVTFSMAFKLNMDQTPGEYAQKVRAKLI